MALSSSPLKSPSLSGDLNTPEDHVQLTVPEDLYIPSTSTHLPALNIPKPIRTTSAPPTTDVQSQQRYLEPMPNYHGSWQQHQHDYMMLGDHNEYAARQYGDGGLPNISPPANTLSGNLPATTEENFCSNFVCCGIYLSDLHALLQHYEDVHVKIEEEEEAEDEYIDIMSNSGGNQRASQRSGYNVSSLVPPLHKRRRVLAFGGIEPCDYSSTGHGVSAFDTTVLRTVPRGASGHMASSATVASSNTSYNPSNYANNTNAPKRPKSVPNMLAAAAASSTLKASLPPALAQNDSQFKLIYSILSSTLDGNSANGNSSAPNREFAHTPSAAAALMSIDAQIQQQMMQRSASINPNSPPGIDKSAERPYVCPIPGCGKAYKNPNGLKYHALHGHDAASEAVEKPHKCPIVTCGKRYKNPNGLKYHLSHAHQSELNSSGAVVSIPPDLKYSRMPPSHLDDESLNS